MNLQNIKKLSKDLEEAIGCDSIHINQLAHKSSIQLDIVFTIEIELIPDNEGMPGRICKSVNDRLESSVYFEQARYKDLQTISEQNDTIQTLEVKVDDLHRYKIFYDLYKDLK